MKKKVVRKKKPMKEPDPVQPAQLLDLRQLEETVMRMRSLGVTEWNGIKIGAVPVEPKIPTPEERAERERERKTRERDIQFAACRVRPLIEGNK